MKKLVWLSLLLFMLFSLTACGRNSNMPNGNVNSSQEKISNTSQPLETQKVSAQGSSQTEKSKRKILIAYFSQARIVSEGADAVSSATPYVGNTASAALEIQKQVGGDIFEIATVDSYPVEHRAASVIAERELKANARPALSTHVKNMESYDVIFIGYPIWWYTEPMAIRTFLEEYNLSGKIIVPFCTTLGAGVAESVNDIKSICPGSTVLEGVTLRTGQQNMSADISKWLSKVGMSE